MKISFLCIMNALRRENRGKTLLQLMQKKAPASNLPANDAFQRAKLQGMQLLFLRLFQLSQQQHIKLHNGSENRNHISPPFTKNVSFEVFFLV